MWEDVLLCQFHDVLPGSSIDMVYEDSAVMYADAMAKGQKIYDAALKTLGFGGEKKSVLNTLTLGQKSSESMISQVASDGLGVTKVTDLQYTPATVEEKEDGAYILRNENLQVIIKGGAIVSLIDRSFDKELVPEGAQSNRLVLFDDQPLYWDAWDVEVHHLETFDYLEPGQVTILDKGPLRASLKVEQKISPDSWVTSTISLDAILQGPSYTGGFNDAVEDRKFLKVEFPWNLHNSTADYKTQFGIVRRPTHFNMTWDSAKFKVICHKFANLNKFRYSVAILNDSKYRFATHSNTQRLSLLRSSKAPDAHADMGRQVFKYAILPHRGTLNQSAVVRAGFNFNSLLHLIDGFVELPKFSVAGAPNVVLETIKKSEDRSDSVLRTYEAYGGAAVANLQTGSRIIQASKVNLLEEHSKALEVKISKLEVQSR
ncbi:hypothetical protein CNMCM5793_001991 [Aspergillus hiratsukae]|uniref:Alpha-mannosidase n=1 Tax=Aspergillus hiratsukae TaxID=1194566 RepID=A0A8H6PBX6_9EURO|nr:hypothetical protein CNMCM5793_001991 [Aspergillus hiratsukae]